MKHTVDPPPLTSVQQCVVDALAAGSTITDAAKAHDVHRMTVYRWMKTLPQFSAALHRARVEFILARRDDLYHLSHRALETLLTVLDNPKSSPAVLLRTAMFILQRPQVPKTGWSMPEPAPDPDGNKLTDSAIIEQDYAQLPGLSGIERDFAAETSGESPVPSAMAVTEAGTEAVTECDEMLHDSPICENVTPAPSAAPHGPGHEATHSPVAHVFPRAVSRLVAAPNPRRREHSGFARSDLEGTYKEGRRGAIVNHDTRGSLVVEFCPKMAVYFWRHACRWMFTGLRRRFEHTPNFHKMQPGGGGERAVLGCFDRPFFGSGYAGV
jgi:hypothetical protein